MDSICIVTDSTVQFPKPLNPIPRAHIEIVPWEISINGNILTDGEKLRVSDLPAFAHRELSPKLVPPSPEQLNRLFWRLTQEFDKVLAIFTSSLIGSIYENAQKAAQDYRGKNEIMLIDSQSLSLGLGYLTQSALEAAAQGESVSDIERRIRNLCPDIYSVLCAPGISYLHYNGFVDQGQAIIGEMLGLYPIFSIENGRLLPVEKVRNTRQALVFFQEFLEEFEQLRHIAVLKNLQTEYAEPRLSSENLLNNISKSIYSEHIINLPNAVLFGPTCLGMFIIESNGQKAR